MFNVILASDIKDGIGKNNTIPWNVPDDVALFKSLTSDICGLKKVVIMGYNTMKSLKNGYLKNRYNIIITSKVIQNENTIYVSTLQDGLNTAYSLVGRDPSRVWVIGGGKLYMEAFNHPDINHIYHSRIMGDYDCDVNIKMPPCDIVSQTNMKSFNFAILKPIMTVERQYLNLLHNVLYKGQERGTRNGITYSLFGRELSFDVSNNFPLLTTKKMFTKGIIEELLFFIRGDTDTNILMEKGINIWKGNTTKEFLAHMNLPYEEGMMGPMYGYQWRFFGKPYNNEGNYVDQFKNLIDILKKDPHSRRLLMTDFNPLMVDMGVLYPCHSLILQFYVQDNMLSVKMYQRSADLFLGLPFNIASTSLLLYIVAKLTNLSPHMVHITLGDCHIYQQHIEQVKEQLSRTPYELPTITIPDFKTIQEVEKSTHTDFIINNYNSHPAIKAEMIA